MNELGYLAHWGRVPFLSRARSAFGGCIPLGSIDSGLCLLTSLMSSALSFFVWLLLATVLHGDSGALFTFFLSPLGGFAFQVIVTPCISIVVGTRRSHSTFVSIDHLRSSSTILIPLCLVCCLPLLHFLPLLGSISCAASSWWLACFRASGIRVFYLNRDSPFTSEFVCFYRCIFT